MGGVIVKKKIIIVVTFILVAIIVFRQIGWLDINLYKSQIGINQSIATHKNTDSKESYSFNLAFKYQDKIISQYAYDDGKSPRISIDCCLEEVNYSGNYRLPFFKTFKVKYKCSVTSVKSASGINPGGTVEGNIDARIIGLCSSKKVKDIILKEITRLVMDVLPQNLKNTY